MEKKRRFAKDISGGLQGCPDCVRSGWENTPYKKMTRGICQIVLSFSSGEFSESTTETLDKEKKIGGKLEILAFHR